MSKRMTAVLWASFLVFFAFGCSKASEPSVTSEAEEPSVEVAEQNIEAEPQAEEIEEAEERAANHDEAARKVADGTGVEACDRYLAAYEQYARCSQVPDAMRDAMRATIEQTKQTWAQLKQLDLYDEMGNACNEGASALREGAKIFGCTIR